MTLLAGTRLGVYEILAPLGSGGMGEVYRARDTKLNRDVAIKILPDAFATDADRVARFTREAQTLATLNHPHIAQIYGLEQSSATAALVMELVEGEDLAQRIARGAIPLDGALAIARQIAEALEAAHEKGIIHRDLKPANIKLTPDGTVKVLDFGLAKAVDRTSAAAASATMSPTLSLHATQAGVILGTAAYMSPEQAKGKPVDKRGDVWAFGCVLYEMLTGQRAFGGDDASDTLAAVLRAEPDWSAVPPHVPPRVLRILKRCVDKDLKARIPDVSAIRFLLDEPLELQTTTPAAGTRRRPLRWMAAAIAVAVVGIAAATGWYFARTAPRPVARFFVQPPDGTTFTMGGLLGASVAVSPDGMRIAFTARDAAGRTQLWIRPVDSLTVYPLAGTDGAAWPAWSPDGRFIAYRADRNLMKIAASGGPPQTVTLCAGCTGGRGVAWSPDGSILFGTGGGLPVQRVSSGGGQPSNVALPAGQTGQDFPAALPDGRHFLYYGYTASADGQGIFVSTLDGSSHRRLVTAHSGGVYDPHHGHLLFVRQGTLLAQPFDPERLVLSGEPSPIAQHVDVPFAGASAFSVSSNGVLAYGLSQSGDGTQRLELTWVDRAGTVVGQVGPPAHYRGIDLAPDGKRVAAERLDDPGGDVWISEVSRGTTYRATFDASQNNSSPIWSPDGNQIAFASIRAGKWGLYRKPANGAGEEEHLVDLDGPVSPFSWSPDGRMLVYQTAGPKTGSDLWGLPLTGERKPVPLVQTPFTESHGQISPDGRWLAYYSSETGRAEVYVKPFPDGPGRWQVSINGGIYPRWSATGRELFYMDQASGGKLMAVDIMSKGAAFEAGTPKALFDTGFVNRYAATRYHAFAVSPDGQRFLIPRRPGEAAGAAAPSPIAVVLNWADALNR